MKNELEKLINELKIRTPQEIFKDVRHQKTLKVRYEI